jgi:hypothetical protein
MTRGDTAVLLCSDQAMHDCPTRSYDSEDAVSLKSSKHPATAC